MFPSGGVDRVDAYRKRIDREQPRSDAVVEQAWWRPSTFLMEKVFRDFAGAIPALMRTGWPHRPHVLQQVRASSCGRP
jgi:hypothetical protein